MQHVMKMTAIAVAGMISAELSMIRNLAVGDREMAFWLMQDWLTSDDLASVRDPMPLATFPVPSARSVDSILVPRP